MSSPSLTRRDLILAAARFLATFVVCYVLVDHVSAVQTGVVDPCTRGLARVSGGLLSALGFGVKADGTWIRSASVDLNIRRGCDGILASAVYLSAVIAYPTTWGARALGLVGGLVLLHLVNLGRILSLFFVQTYAPSLFEKVHVAFWQALMILVAVLIWSLWERTWGYPARRVAGPSPAGPAK